MLIDPLETSPFVVFKVKRMKNILSIDLESWVHFHGDALGIKRSRFSSSERKSIDNHYIPDVTNQILNLLDEYNQKATFFIIGELYDWYPSTIEDIESRGHEIGYHTQTHRLLRNKEILEEELKKSSAFLRRFNPAGFRAPEIFITRDSFACLKKYGFKYSSSSYSGHGITNIDGIDEIPVSAFCFKENDVSDQHLPKNLTIKMLFKQIPFGSGIFISLFGSKISYFIDSLNMKGVPAILFFHPWQLYTHKQITKPSFRLKLLSCNPLCLPYTINIKKAIEKLFNRHSFLSFRGYYEY